MSKSHHEAASNLNSNVKVNVLCFADATSCDEVSSTTGSRPCKFSGCGDAVPSSTRLPATVQSVYPSPFQQQHHHHTHAHRRGSLQLWQFLVGLLDNHANNTVISWTGITYSFIRLNCEGATCTYYLKKRPEGQRRILTFDQFKHLRVGYLVET